MSNRAGRPAPPLHGSLYRKQAGPEAPPYWTLPTTKAGPEAPPYFQDCSSMMFPSGSVT
jgi:hypothetical protein